MSIIKNGGSISFRRSRIKMYGELSARVSQRATYKGQEAYVLLMGGSCSNKDSGFMVFCTT